VKTVALYLRVSTGEQTVENQRRELLTRRSRPFAPLSIASAAACRISWRSSASSTAPVDLYLDRQGLDTSTPAGKALFQMLGVFAEFERSIIQERITAGIARARAKAREAGGRSAGRSCRQSARPLYGLFWRPGRASGRPHGSSAPATRQWRRSPPRCARRNQIPRIGFRTGRALFGAPSRFWRWFRSPLVRPGGSAPSGQGQDRPGRALVRPAAYAAGELNASAPSPG
jgi:Resolvase, N terminal domain